MITLTFELEEHKLPDTPKLGLISHPVIFIDDGGFIYTGYYHCNGYFYPDQYKHSSGSFPHTIEASKVRGWSLLSKVTPFDQTMKQL